MNPASLDDTNDPVQHSANPGYALDQLNRALAASWGHPDAATRERAATRAGRWFAVFRDMVSGALHVGSRTPVAAAPAWATLEVLHGGFASGHLLAGGELQPHEQELIGRIGAGSTATPRAALNGYYLSEAGFPELRRMLATGCYRVNVPEEGALLAVAWLLAHGSADAARDLLDQLAPQRANLRFYPVPDPRPLAMGALVQRQTAGETARELLAIRIKPSVAVQREATLVWAPLVDRMADLFMQTVEGPAPALREGADGAPLRTEGGKFVIDGGWPCAHYPEGWQARAADLLNDYRGLRQEHTLSREPERRGRSFALLRGYLETCVEDPRRLTGRDVGMIRLLLAGIGRRRGFPGSARCTRLREMQRSLAGQPTKAELARVVAGRLAELPADEGVESPDSVLGPVTPAEAGVHGVPAGHSVARLGGRVHRALAAPVEVLVEQEIIPSAEVLATVVPQLTAQVRAAGIDDAELRRLYGAVYQAFRRRRSLLLLDLQSQVKLDELPWVQAIDAQRRGGPGAQRLARDAFEHVAVLTLTAFPQQILPNQMLRELRALADAAGLRLPLTEELAADIFMGEFVERFVRAAQAAGELLEGTLYERYYGISYARVREIDDFATSPWGGPRTSAAFRKLCEELAGPETGGAWTARNGAVIEQQQILTTHNLAALFGAGGLGDALRPRLGELARRCFTWTCTHLQMPGSHWRVELHRVKNAAYAWRQMVFFLALEPEDSVREFIAWASARLDAQPRAFQQRFRPALAGLERAVAGVPAEDSAEAPADGTRRFLGWTDGVRWHQLSP